VETVNDFEITVPTQNRFSMLEETSHKEEARVQEQLNVQSKRFQLFTFNAALKFGIFIL
jgi:hypothetical protein